MRERQSKPKDTLCRAVPRGVMHYDWLLRHALDAVQFMRLYLNVFSLTISYLSPFKFVTVHYAL